MVKDNLNYIKEELRSSENIDCFGVNFNDGVIEEANAIASR